MQRTLMLWVSLPFLVSKTGEYNSRVRGRGRGDYGSERGRGFDRGRGSDRGGRGGLDI